jgi:hypothetical protein
VIARVIAMVLNVQFVIDCVFVCVCCAATCSDPRLPSGIINFRRFRHIGQVRGASRLIAFGSQCLARD